MKGTDNCKWLIRGSTELCGKSCLKDYCKVHLMRLREGASPMRLCTGCGVGVGNVVGLCGACDYNKIESRLRMRRVRAFEKEFMRLAAINISI